MDNETGSSHTIDWLSEFVDRFRNDKYIQNLKADDFHGSIQLNFCNGVVQNYDFKLHRRCENNKEG